MEGKIFPSITFSYLKLMKKVKTKKKIKTKKKSSKKIKESVVLYDSLTSIRFDLHGKTYEVDVGSELLVENEDLHSQVERIPAVMGYFGSIVSKLNQEYKDKKVLEKNIEAKIDRRIRESGIIGEVRIDKAIKRHPKWVEACLEVNKAKEKSNRAKLLYASLKEKSIVLLSRSSDIRSVPSDSIKGVSREDVIAMDEDDGD